MRPVYNIAENEMYMKIQATRLGVYKAICLAVKHHGHGLAAQIAITHSLQYFEHLAEPMAECLDHLSKEFDHAQLADEILREIAGKTFSAQDSKGPRVFSKFLTRFSELAPRQVLKQLALLLAQLDSESYPMRNALVDMIGNIIRELAEAPEDGEAPNKGQHLKQINGLYDLLLERTMDISSYTRVKVFNTFARLCDATGTGKFPQQRLAMTRAAVDALEDKTSSVRKSAISLLERLILTHPYGMYGGLLSETEWKEKYKEVSDMLEKMEGAVGKAVEVEQEEEEEESQRGDDDEEGEGEGDEDEDEDEDEGQTTRVLSEACIRVHVPAECRPSRAAQFHPSHDRLPFYSPGRRQQESL